THERSTLSLHDALPISSTALASASRTPTSLRMTANGRTAYLPTLLRFSSQPQIWLQRFDALGKFIFHFFLRHGCRDRDIATGLRSEEHTSELQSRGHLV